MKLGSNSFNFSLYIAILVKEWKWQKPADTESSWVVLSENDQLVTFHPFYSGGTAAVKGDTPMKLNCHYYWEVKMLTDTYGTDIVSLLFNRLLKKKGDSQLSCIFVTTELPFINRFAELFFIKKKLAFSLVL